MTLWAHGVPTAVMPWINPGRQRTTRRPKLLRHRCTVLYSKVRQNTPQQAPRFPPVSSVGRLSRSKQEISHSESLLAQSMNENSGGLRDGYIYPPP